VKLRKELELAISLTASKGYLLLTEDAWFGFFGSFPTSSADGNFFKALMCLPILPMAGIR
jgi:hypothetical protein